MRTRSGVDLEVPSRGGDNNDDDLTTKIEATLESYSAVFTGKVREIFQQMVDEQITDLISERVCEVVKEEFEKRFPTPQVEGGADEGFLNHGIPDNTNGRGFSYKDFKLTKPPIFEENPDPLISTRWISDVEGCFRVSECPPEKKTRLATSLLRGTAKTWLDDKILVLGEGPFMSLSWDDFKTEFFLEYRTQADLTRIRNELRNLRQGSMDLNTLKATFLAKVRFCPKYIGNDRMLMEDFHKTLNDDMRKKISLGHVKSFSELFNVANDFESDVPKVGDASFNKRKFEASNASAKRAKSGAESVGSVKKGGPGGYTPTCFNCGQKGHYSSDCTNPPTSKITCFNCRKEGHRKSECPDLGLGEKSKDNTKRLEKAAGPARGRNFMMTTDAARNSNEVVSDCPLCDRDFPLQVEITDGRFSAANGANLDCQENFVRVRTPSGGEIIVYGEARRRPVPICTYARARRLVFSGGMSYLAHVVDTHDEPPSINSIPIVNEFVDVFADELPGVPPVRQVEFRIDLVPGANPIAKTPYRLAPNEMLELLNQTQEL
ncbi:uncharacterized protein [Rutidosis leptorrhynchoides]|uniref:uncharacterized protein n=1 Tax=Rutidosis leptorrhynchoides TaxID=125765 RepID=UPI003A991D5F